MYSVVILTLNEAQRLPGCLASVAMCDDVVVLDSGSTDNTLEVAKAAGARIFSNPFQNFAQQRNHAHDRIPFRHPWLLHLDADERMTAELHAECMAWCPAPGVVGAWIAPKMLWRERWIRRCTDFPAWQARFVNPESFRFIEVGHGQREAPGTKLAYFQNNYLHDLSSEGVDGWLEKHRRYARVEAKEQFQATPLPWSDLVASDRLVRRRALKQLSYRLPLRSLARFVYQYILRQGFRDGRAGWEYCRLIARYEGFAQNELRALRRSRRSPQS
ncbi:glycosyltransferase family 2 protein [Synoicihabitans lomoniglobus]|uniref:Glycosyltransferase family 2 protein n=1 Tax=Synoicihabitans lomoniglobus TaxID=2909285 RepID=A0AAF0CSL8_9BACT|nr:glycosyltransferase family 2 protein [Opitutaceae bacterium LMO-M01]WED67344.1 glycosyltransferase family 2 protein [Opitutaceae bacterium LMO-M01]